MLFFVDADQKVIWFHVPVDEMIIVQVLDPLQHLVSNHDDSLVAELPLAVHEQVLQARPQQVHHHRVVVALHAEPVHTRYPSYYIEQGKFRIKNSQINYYYLPPPVSILYSLVSYSN